MSAENWIEEKHDLWRGQKFCLQIKRELFHQKSLYQARSLPKWILNNKIWIQDVRVIESEAYGNVLILDGIIQCTERDEASYSEMMAHMPLCSLKAGLFNSYKKKALPLGPTKTCFTHRRRRRRRRSRVYQIQKHRNHRRCRN